MGTREVGGNVSDGAIVDENPHRNQNRNDHAERVIGIASSDDDNPGSSANTRDSGAVLGENRNRALDAQQTADWNSSVDRFRQYFSEKLGIQDVREPELPMVLEELSMDGIAKFIKDGECKNILVMAGAGISTAAGIPDFRSPSTGIYHKLESYGLPEPYSIFDINYFRERPQPFFTLAKELYPGSFKPTVSHYFIKLLYQKGLLLRHYTQNFDTLERVAGLPEEKLVEAHGSFHTSHCLECDKDYSQSWMKEQIFNDVVPTCTGCNGVVKPDVVFLNEGIHKIFHERGKLDGPRTDLLIILGSSLVVQPFASLIDRVPLDCPRLLINREKVNGRLAFMELMGYGRGMDFDSEANTRDVFWKGDCDDGCLLLADKLGWGDELREMVEEEHRKIDEAKDKEDAESSGIDVKNEEPKENSEEILNLQQMVEKLVL